jgi:glycerol uptake facilitator-like aquaporin
VQTEQIGVWWGAAVLTLLQTAGNSDSEAQTEQIGVWWGAAVLTLVQTAGNGDSGVQTEQIGVWWGFAVLTLVQTAGNGDFSGYEQPFSRRENVQPRRTHRSWPRS